MIPIFFLCGFLVVDAKRVCAAEACRILVGQKVNFENFENNSMNEYAKHMIVSQEAGCKKVHGMNGLFCSPLSSDVDNLDKFADAEGKLSCTDNSGLSNSKGGLCLTDDHRRLLSTRGGNSTGCNAPEGGDKTEEV